MKHIEYLTSESCMIAFPTESMLFRINEFNNKFHEIKISIYKLRKIYKVFNIKYK